MNLQPEKHRGALGALLRAAGAAALPAPRLNVGDWLDKNRVIPRQYPSAFPGPWRTSRTPYMREPLEAFADPEVETIVLLWSSQIGKTELILGTLLYAYGVDPGPGLFVFPTLHLADEYSVERLAPALQTCAVLKVGEQKARKVEDAKRHKAVNGFPLDLGGANSAAGLASKPVRFLWCDEIDRWAVQLKNEGDPLKLAIQRTESFRRRKKVFTSTPTVKGSSRIEEYYANSDQRRLWAPCPRCGEEFVPEWKHVQWQTQKGEHYPDTAVLVCPWCQGSIKDGERQAMFTKARWIPDNPGSSSRIRGYRLWSVVCPWMPLSRGVERFLEAKKSNDPTKLREWINLYLGESWEEPSLKIESQNLLARRVEYPAEVPAGVQVLTAGVDTQDDRLELMVTGWGAGEESWVVSRETIPGDPDLDATWQELDHLLKRGYQCERGGTMRVQATLVDCLGHRTGSVYKALRTRQQWRIYASVGMEKGIQGQLVSPPKPQETSVGTILRCAVGTSEAKGLIYARLGIKGDDGQPLENGPGVVHFPMWVGDAFFTELTAEHLITTRKPGAFPSKKWQARPGVRRNESLDCFVMSLAALRVVCPNPARFADLAAKVEAARAAEAALATQPRLAIPGTPNPSPGRLVPGTGRRTVGWRRPV